MLPAVLSLVSRADPGVTVIEEILSERSSLGAQFHSAAGLLAVRWPRVPGVKVTS